MKFLFQIDGRGIGGNETLLRNLIVDLRQKGHPVCLVSGPGAGGEFLGKVATNTLSRPENAQGWQKLVGSVEPEVGVSVHGDIWPMAAALAKSKIPNIWFCGHPLGQSETSMFHRALSHCLMDAILVPSAFVGSGLDSSRTRVFPNGVDLNFFCPPSTSLKQEVRTRLGFSERDFVVGAAGRFADYKRWEDLLEAFCRLQEQVPEARLMLLCREGSFSFLKKDVEKVTALCAEPDEMAYWMSAMDVLAHPAEGEGLGCVILEALAMKIPAVVTQTGGPLELLRKARWGLAVPRRSPRSFVRALKILRDQPALRSRLGQVGRDWVEKKYSRTQMQKIFLEVSQELVGVKHAY